MLTSLVVDLLATGERRRLGAALELGIDRLTEVLRSGASERAAALASRQHTS